MTSSSLEKFQSLLRELFQFDCADLDFGIYRIMNHKRDVVEKWITETLPARVEAELRTGALRADSTTADRLDELKGQLTTNFGADALDGDGNLAAAFHGTPLGKQYLELRKAAEHAIGGGDQRAIVFNHLYQFFSHYYDSGDFLSLRRYSARQKYAIPYNGEEVHLHWANADQYYIKTSEYFTDYRWKAPGAMGDEGFTVLFKLRNAEQETGNNKANEKRYFCFSPEELEYDEASRTLTLPAAYRALDKEEAKSFTGNGEKPQQMLGESALAGVRAHALVAKNASIKAAILAPARNSAGQAMVDSQTKEPVPLLLKHLRTYARRNNSDFFIHKDLSGFLTRELDFYLKNEVLSLDTLLAGGPRPSEGWFQLLHVIKTLGNDIIAFLAQLENFQKTLFEKKKFVTDCHWCLTLDRVSASLLPEIAANPRQWEQWEDLHKISTIEPKAKTWVKGKDLEKALAWLKSMPFLMVDTSLFKDSDFQDRLLATVPDIEGQMDGLLVNSENFQGLNFLNEITNGTVNCCYTDPPYNTLDGDFAYKDNYAHSSWLSMISESFGRAFSILSNQGFLVSHLDEHEISRCEIRLGEMFGVDSMIGPVVWDKRNPKGDATGIAAQHEYLVWCAKSPDWLNEDKHNFRRKKKNAEKIIDKAKQLLGRRKGSIEAVREEFREWVLKQDFTGGERAYCLLDDNGEVYRPVSMAWPNKKKAPDEYFEPLFHPRTKKACPVPQRGWRNPPATMAELLKKDQILFGADEKTQPNRKYLLREHMTENVPSVFYFGGSDEDLFSGMNLNFENPKPHLFSAEIIEACLGQRKDSLVLDFFGGSGTTAHAVIHLNREDGRNRKYILIEMGDHFNTVLKKRIQKVSLSKNWKSGAPIVQKKPVDPKNPYHGISQAFKVVRLESYEDALANIEFSHQTEGELFTKQVGAEYLLKYALEFETQGSATRLCPEALTAPFEYRLNLFDGTETRSKPVDLPETFHYLIGLKVETRRWIERKAGKVTHRYLHVTGTANGDGKRVTVLWRTVPAGWKEADYQAEKQWAREAKLFEGADRGWYNGPGTLLDAQPLDSEFRRLLFA